MPEVRDVDRVDEWPAAAGEQAALIATLSAVREELLEVAEGWRPWISGREADRDASARNLLQYLALRRHDLRELQDPLVALGLSSLGGSEGHVQASVEAVLAALRTLVEHPPQSPSGSTPIRFGHSRGLLAGRSEALLGPARRGRPTRIMVTMPTEAATDPGLGARDAGGGDGLHEDQLRPRRRAAVESDAREPPRGREADPATGACRG